MQVRVHNDNVHDLKEKFKGDDVVIPAGKFIEMELFEANDFRGQYKPISVLANGLQDPTTFKMLRIEKITGADDLEAPALHVCQACNKKYESAPVLKAHTETEHANQLRLEVPEVDEKIKKRVNKAG